MKSILAVLVAVTFSWVAQADTKTPSQTRKTFCFATVGEFEPVVFDLTLDQGKYGVIEGDGVKVHYQVTYFISSESQQPALYLVFSVTENGKVIMASTDTFTNDGETSLTAQAAHTEIQHALATNPKLETINDAYVALNIPETVPFLVHMSCSLMDEKN